MEAKDAHVRMNASTRRIERRRWEARFGTAGSHAVIGEGETEKEALEDLRRNVEWATHYIGAFIAVDGAGGRWLCTVGSRAQTWYVIRCTGDESVLSTGSAVCTASSYSKLRAEIATWNTVEEG